jgi:serine protease AprX
MSRITINGISLDPVLHAEDLRLAGLEAADASASDYILIQTSAPLSAAQTADLQSLSVVVNEYVSENTYLCTYKEADLTRLRALPFVTWANVYLRGFKIPPSLRPSGVSSAELILPMAAEGSHLRTERPVDVVFHDDVDPQSDALKAAVAAAARVDQDGLEFGVHKVRLVVEERFLEDLAALDAVRVIEPVPERKLRNNVARTILNAQVVVSGTTYEGAGQVIAVADTGFDQGSTTSPHPAFTGRVDRLYPLGRPGPPGKADDPEGHGTHVCGSALGDGASPSMGGAIRGTAPQAHLVVQSLLGPGGIGDGIPADLTDLFLPPYRDDGARVHTNSWGNRFPAVPYDQSAREIDDFVWNHPDMVICWSAGNDGTDRDGDGVVDPAQVGSEAAAKNCITVGASESERRNIDRTYGSLRPSDFPKNPIHDDPMANHAEGMAAFSSRGPTQESRYKPDVVAPGTSILSSHSRNAPAASTTFGSSSDPDYFFDSGTSMATPLVAGCAAVLRETLVRNGFATPPAALIKALLINGAVELVGQYSPSEAGLSPNGGSGFGRVNLLASVILPGPNPDAGFGEGGPLKQGDEETFTVEIPPQPPGHQERAVGPSAGIMALGATFKITLVWSDPAGPDLQNDLDLIVKAADGSERHGNMGTSAAFDRVNNVEQLLWASMPAGPAAITIRADRITRFSQPYAFAWRIS